MIRPLKSQPARKQAVGDCRNALITVSLSRKPGATSGRLQAPLSPKAMSPSKRVTFFDKATVANRRRTASAKGAFAALCACLALAGGGCQEAGDEVGEAIVQPMAAPVAALNQAKGTLSEAQAQANEQAESIANEMTVAMVLTDGAVPPEGTALGETFGCNDRIAFVKAPRESDSGNTLQDVVASLLAVREPTFRGLYNSLSQSRLAVERIRSADGVTTEVWLTGEVSSGGTCDDPRIRKQVEATVARLKPKFKIILNGSADNWDCLGDMSGQCGQ